MTDDNSPPHEDKPAVLHKMKDRLERKQVMAFKAFSLSRLVQMMQRVMEKSSRRACQLFSCSMLCSRPSICSGQKEQQQHTETRHTGASAWCPPSTILIVNISNSTLNDCVIGNEAFPPAVVEKQPLMQGPLQDMCDSNGCYSYQGCPAPAPSIQINSSNLRWVIIGDNNYMQVEQTLPSEEESGALCEDRS